jgi:hypothetical protein
MSSRPNGAADTQRCRPSNFSRVAASRLAGLTRSRVFLIDRKISCFSACCCGTRSSMAATKSTVEEAPCAFWRLLSSPTMKRSVEASLVRMTTGSML